MAIKEQNITLNKGLQMDVNPLFQGDGCLSDCLNGVLISKVGQNFCLQQDSGNGRVGTAYLPEGFIPCCTASMGNIVYLVLFNPLTKDVEVGSFPSPKTIYDTVDNGEAYSLASADFQEFDSNGNPTGRIYNTKQYINLNTPSLSTGDKFLVYEGSKNQNDKSNIDANKGSISDVGDSKHVKDRLLRPLSYKYFVEDKNGQRHDIDYIDLWYKNNYTIPTIELNASTGVPDIDSYRTTIMQAFNSFTSKYRGSLGICWYLNIVETYTYSGVLSKNNNKLKFSLYVTWDDESEKKSPAGFYLLSKSISEEGNVIIEIENNKSSKILPYDKVIFLNNYYKQTENSSNTISDFLSNYTYKDANLHERSVSVNDDIKYYNNHFYVNATHIKNETLGFIENGEFKEAPYINVDYSELVNNNIFFSEFSIRYLHKSVHITDIEVDSKYVNKSLSLSIAPCLGNYGAVIPLSRDINIPLVLNESDNIMINKWQYSVATDVLYLNMDMSFPYKDSDLNPNKLILKFYLPFKSDNKYLPIYTKTISLNGSTYINSQIVIPVVNLNSQNESNGTQSGALIYGFLYGVSLTVVYSKYNDLIEINSNNEEVASHKVSTSKFLWCSRMFNVENVVDDYDNVQPVLNLTPTLEFKMNSDTHSCSESGLVEKGSYDIKCSVENKYITDTNLYETLYLDESSNYYKSLVDKIGITILDSADNNDINSNLNVSTSCKYEKGTLNISLKYTITALVESQKVSECRIYVPFLNSNTIESLGLYAYKYGSHTYIIPRFHILYDDDYSDSDRGHYAGIIEYKGNSLYKIHRTPKLTSNMSSTVSFTTNDTDKILRKSMSEASGDNVLMFASILGQENSILRDGNGTWHVPTTIESYIIDRSQSHGKISFLYRTTDEDDDGHIKYIPGNEINCGTFNAYLKAATSAVTPLFYKYVYSHSENSIVDEVSFVKGNQNIQIPIRIYSELPNESDNSYICIQKYKLSDYVDVLCKIDTLENLSKDVSCINPKIELNTVDTYISFNKTFSNSTSVRKSKETTLIPSIAILRSSSKKDIISSSDLPDDCNYIYSRGSEVGTKLSRNVNRVESANSFEFHGTNYYNIDTNPAVSYSNDIDYHSNLKLEDNSILWNRYKIIFEKSVEPVVQIDGEHITYSMCTINNSI